MDMDIVIAMVIPVVQQLATYEPKPEFRATKSDGERDTVPPAHTGRPFSAMDTNILMAITTVQQARAQEEKP